MTQKDTPQPSLKEEDVETNEESDDSISHGPKISEPPKEESVSEDKEKSLI